MRGEKFLEMRRKDLLHPQIWKELEADPELIALERAMLEAAADVKVGWMKVRDAHRSPPWSRLLSWPIRRPPKEYTE